MWCNKHEIAANSSIYRILDPLRSHRGLRLPISHLNHHQRWEISRKMPVDRPDAAICGPTWSEQRLSRVSDPQPRANVPTTVCLDQLQKRVRDIKFILYKVSYLKYT